MTGSGATPCPHGRCISLELGTEGGLLHRGHFSAALTSFPFVCFALVRATRLLLTHILFKPHSSKAGINLFKREGCHADWMRCLCFSDSHEGKRTTIKMTKSETPSITGPRPWETLPCATCGDRRLYGEKFDGTVKGDINPPVFTRRAVRRSLVEGSGQYHSIPRGGQTRDPQSWPRPTRDRGLHRTTRRRRAKLAHHRRPAGFRGRHRAGPRGRAAEITRDLPAEEAAGRTQVIGRSGVIDAVIGRSGVIDAERVLPPVLQ